MRKKHYFGDEWIRDGRWDIKVRKDSEHPWDKLASTTSESGAYVISKYLEGLEKEAQHYHDLLIKHGIDPKEEVEEKKPEKPKGKRKRLIQI